MSAPNTNQIAASPQQIRQLAQQATLICGKMRSVLSETDKKVSASAFFWSADSADMIRRFYSEDKAEIEAAQELLALHIAKLETIVSRYEEAESVSLEETAALPGSVLE